MCISDIIGRELRTARSNGTCIEIVETQVEDLIRELTALQATCDCRDILIDDQQISDLALAVFEGEIKLGKVAQSM